VDDLVAEPLGLDPLEDGLHLLAGGALGHVG
jgi:hypothetical protein